MGMLKEFQDFAMKGNVVDMAVGVVIGGAFGKVVSAFVEKIIMPFVGLVSGGIDFSGKVIELKPAVKADPSKDIEAAEAVTLGIGTMATVVIDFIIIAFAIFIAVKMLNAAKAKFEKKEAEKPAEPAADIQLLTEIRDALKKG